MRTAFLVATAAFAGVLTPAMGQVNAPGLMEEESEEVDEPIRRYTVELTIFTHGEAAAGTEIWLPDEAATDEMQDKRSDDYSDADPAEFPESGEVLAEIEMPAVARRYMDLELALLAPDDYSMNSIYDKLVELDAYQPIMRAGWTQPTYEKSVTASIGLLTLADAPPWLEGSLTLYRGRYLHLVVDLTMNADRRESLRPEEPSAAVVSFGDSRLQNEYQIIDEYGELLPPPIRYRIFEDRIMRNGDIRYFDHPMFGMIAKITRVEETEEDDIIDDTDDLLPGSLLSHAD